MEFRYAGLVNETIHLCTIAGQAAAHRQLRPLFGLSAADANVCIPGNWCGVVKDCEV